MPRPAPERGAEAYTLSFSVPRYLAAEVQAQVEPGYGGQTALFRKVWAQWMDERSLRDENTRLKMRVLQLERAFRKVQTAVRDAA